LQGLPGKPGWPVSAPVPSSIAPWGRLAAARYAICGDETAAISLWLVGALRGAMRAIWGSREGICGRFGMSSRVDRTGNDATAQEQQDSLFKVNVFSALIPHCSSESLGGEAICNNRAQVFSFLRTGIVQQKWTRTPVFVTNVFSLCYGSPS